MAVAMGVGAGFAALPATSVFAQDQLAPNAAPQTFLIEFAEPGMLEHQVRGERQRFDARAPETVAYQNELMAIQAQRKAAMEAALGRSIAFNHHYLVTHSGVSATLTFDEAERLRSVPGVVSVEVEKVYELDTYAGPAFIGAPGIWNGAHVPSGLATRGAGMVAGVLDSGIVFPHPSFNNDASCGHGTTLPNKVLSFLDCATTDGAGLCNGPSPIDTNGHGSHTSSTMAGNRLDGSAVPPPTIPAGYTEISGVAPCAHIRHYKVCPGTSCPGAAIQAGMNSILLHGDVDVMNFSISGGTSPWTDNDRRKLDLVDAGVFVAASAGNTSATVPNPVGQVNHRGPWVLSVAASTHSGQASGLVSASGPGTPPANTQNLPATKGSDSPNASNQTNLPIRHFTGQVTTAEGCTAGADGAPADLPPFPAGFFNGAAALIHRGTCPFTVKITNAFNAGAALVIIRNNQAAAMSMSTVGQPNVPAYSIEQVQGNNLVAFVDANPTTATINFDAVNGDVLAGFSLRGPTPAPLADLTKPDITAPGVSIYAAYTGASGYGNSSGTSMSGPHAAGAALLLKTVQPNWTDAELKSALMMTAHKVGRKDNVVSNWDWDDVGSGRVDLTKAARAGLVMHETTANYLAANPATAGDVKTLNIPAVRNMNCTPNCSWTRTVRNTLSGPSSWTTAGTAITPGFTITVSPSSFSFNGTGIPPTDAIFVNGFENPAAPETQVLTITATPNTNLTAAVAFGEVTLTETGARSPQQHITVAIRGEGGAGGPEIEVTPASISGTGEAGGTTVTAPMTIGNTGGSALNWTIAEAPDSIVLPGEVFDRGAPVQITQSTSMAPVAGSIACGVTGQPITRANSYWRRFYFNEHPAVGPSTTLASIDFAVEATANGQTLTVNAYTTPASVPVDTIDVAQLTLIGTATVAVAGGTALQPINVPITGTIADTTTQSLVVEVSAPDGQATTPASSFYIGSNAAGQTHPSFISTAACGIASPTNLASIGFPNMHIAMAVNLTGGGAPTGCDAPADVPWLSVSPTNGSTSAGGSTPTTVSMNPGSLPAGTYTANLCVASNDATDPVVEVPVEFEVEPAAPAGFCTTGAITIPATGTAAGVAGPYPAPIAVTGVGEISAVRVAINGANHTWPDDLDILLVGPGGQNLVVQSDVGGGSTTGGTLVNVSYVIDDAAAIAFPDGAVITNGTSYRPTNFVAGDTFDAPAPAGPYTSPAPVGAATLTSIFGGTNANGTWNVYIRDDAAGDTGSIASICLDFDASAPPEPVVLFDSYTDAFITHPTGGFGGAPAARLQGSLGLTNLGANNNGNATPTAFAISDDFTVPAGGWSITRFKAYGYQTGGSTTSSFTGLRVWILNGPPNDPGSAVVFGNETTNVMTSTAFSGVYRDSELSPGDGTRAVHELVADFGTPITLPAGQYWIVYNYVGSLASGPWAPSRNILGQAVTGDAWQRTSAGVWQAFSGIAADVNGPRQGLPFILEGTAP